MTRWDRIAGTVYGAAVGDALGAAFEFVDAAQIERRLGSAFARSYVAAMPGSLLAPRAPGKATDDTAMALSLASTIASDEPLTPAVVATRFLRDLERGRGRFAELFWTGGPGGATTFALGRLRSGAEPADCGRAEDGGNGTAMRAYAAGFLPDRAEALRVAAMQARVTHGHPSAVAAAAAVAALVHDALAGLPPSLDVPEGIDDPTFGAAWRDLHAHVRPSAAGLPHRLRNVAMSAWETVAAAHAIVRSFPGDPFSAIAAAAASGGDTDTVATIAGAIAGAEAGVDSLPSELVSGLGCRALVEDVLAELSQSRRLATVAELT